MVLLIKEHICVTVTSLKSDTVFCLLSLHFPLYFLLSAYQAFVVKQYNLFKAVCNGSARCRGTPLRGVRITHILSYTNVHCFTDFPTWTIIIYLYIYKYIQQLVCSD